MHWIKSNAKTYRDLSDPGFRKLAVYIFRGNEDKTQISMTSPVQMDINDTVSTMSFVMSSYYNQANLPKPNNPDVILKEKQYEYVVVIQFSGFESDKELKVHSKKLQNIQNLVDRRENRMVLRELALRIERFY